MVVVSRPDAGLKPADQQGPSPPPVLPVAEPPPVAPRRPVMAGWGLRVWAGIIDLLPFLGAYGIERAVVATAGPDWRWIALPFDYAALTWMIYNQYRAGVTGQSLGKRVVGLRLVKEEDGSPIGGGMAVLRYILHIIDSLPIFLGFLWPIWDAKRQTLADKAMRSLVLKVDGSDASP